MEDVLKKASAANMALPNEGKFYLGFDPYQTQPPKAEAVGALGRQLSAIKWVVDTMIENKITTLVSLTRTPLPEEGMASNQRGGQQPRSARKGMREIWWLRTRSIFSWSRGPTGLDIFWMRVVGPSAPSFISRASFG